jgi:hypothetical protein
MEALLSRFGAVGDTMPITWDRMLPDATGRLWLRHSACVNERERIWDIVDTSGAIQGHFRTADYLVAAYGTHFLARGEDSLGVPQVTRMKLVPPSP